jgi:hypothetical protein
MPCLTIALKLKLQLQRVVKMLAHFLPKYVSAFLYLKAYYNFILHIYRILTFN